MKTKLTSVLLATSLLLPLSANAFFFDTTPEETTTTVVESTVDFSQVLLLIQALADDIGEMADRILVMADKIGEMADRIVQTEEIMADLAVDIAEIKANTSGTTTAVDGVYITQGFQTTLFSGEAPAFVMSATSSEYLVYVSSSMTMDTNTISVLVHNPAELAAQWSYLESLASDHKIYVAVKTIENNSISSLSNVLSYTTTF